MRAGSSSSAGAPVLPRDIYGVLGMPLGHSLSPVLHTWAMQRAGWPGAYYAFEREPEQLAAFMSAVRQLPVNGLSVTIPHKQAVIPMLDGLTDLARRVGAVNTVFWKDGRLLGHNTDVEGFIAPLAGRTVRRALLLGAGGVSRAALVGLQDLGVDNVLVAARAPGKAAPLEREFGLRVIPWEERAAAMAAFCPDLVVNATPLGMHGERQNMSPLPESAWAGPAGKGLAYDLVYNPLETLFLRQAAAAGWHTQDALLLFVEQGRAQLRLWTGVDLPARDAWEMLRHRLES